MIEFNHVWTSTGSSGALTPALQVHWPASESVMYCQISTIATTTSYRVETAQESSGPWFNEGSTACATNVGAQQTAIRITGPYHWIRPFIQTASTGAWQFRLLGVS